MGLRNWMKAVREYPVKCEEVDELGKLLVQAETELQMNEKECTRLEDLGREQQHEQNLLKQKLGGCMDILRRFGPKPDTAEHMMKFYETVMPAMDPEGFTLYFTAKEMTGFHSCYAFPYEDNRGMFEEANGHDLMPYLLADRFGAVDWNIVPGTCYESATLLEVDKTTPEYQAFAKELYEKTLRKMGFGDLLPQERSPLLTKGKEGCNKNER